MESFTYGSLAQIQVLLLPIGDIPRSTFERWSKDVRSVDTVRLGDLTTDVKDERSRFMPNHQLASGHLHLAYPSHPPPESHASLGLFRTSDFPLAVVGIASCGANDSLATILAQFQTTIREVFPPESMFPRASNCFVFEENDSTTNINLGDHFPGLVVIPSVMGHKKTYIGTLIADLCSKVLVELATVMQILESPLGNEYLNAALFPVLPPSSEIPRSLDDEPRRDSLPPLPSHNSQPDLNGQLRAKSPLGLRRASTMSPGFVPNRHASLPISPASVPKKRPTTIGVASSHGRLFKVLADFFLLAGRLQEASIWQNRRYSEALVLFKSAQDFPWQASAFEGLATISIAEAWASTDGINRAVDDKDPWSEIAEKLNQATALYHKTTPTSDPETTLSLLAYLYCSSVLRHSTLLYTVWSSKGWGPLAFTAMLQPGPSLFLPATLSNNASPVTSSSARNTFADLERLTSITGITRSEISASVGQAHGPWLTHLDPRERMRILEYISSMFGALGYVRKEAYVLREVLGCVMEMVVAGRDETGINSARVVSAGFGSRTSLTINSAQGSVAVRENDRTEGNESILRIVKHVCRVHGINLEAVNLFDSDPPKRDSHASQNPDIEDVEALAESMQEPYGWPELQIDIIWWAISVAEALPDYIAVAQFSLSALKLLHPVMAPRDQHQLYTTASRALMTAKRRGDRRVVDYWSGQPVVGIAIAPLPFVRIPVEKPLSILSQSYSGVRSIIAGVRDPFLYNPRKMVSGQSKSVLVQNESFDLVVTLRNPYVFDLDLQSLQLSTTGVSFISKAIPVLVPANTFHPVTIAGTALEAGTLTIRGCTVQAPGGVFREFVLPLSTDEEEERQSRRRSAIDCETGRSKYPGLGSRSWEKSAKRGSTQIAGPSSRKTTRFLECTIVPEQPLLRIRRTSLTHGAVMLYNGEMSTIRITLENVSSLPIDLLRLTFDNSTVAPAQQALADGDLSVFDTYETEYDLVHRPVFSWDSERESHGIGPGQKRVVTVNCLGKVGCTSGTIDVSYAYVKRPQESLQEQRPEVFHTRQLTYPVLVTVYHMLECHAMDILSYTGSTTSLSQGDDEDQSSPLAKARKTLLHVGDIADWCIFSIEVRNTYGLPFEITFERNQEGVEPASIMSVVPPGSTSRIVLPLKKITLSEEHISRPIPMLSDRQYVVSASKLSPEEERIQRELFWYRERLFQTVHGRWRESGGTRAGDLSLRQERMTLPMLEALRVETARVRMTLVRYDDTGNAQPVDMDSARMKFLSSSNEFVYLRTCVTNLSPSDIAPTLSLTLEPDSFVIYQGELDNIPLGRLEKGESFEVETPVAFIACGRFAFSAEVYILSRPRGRKIVGHGEMLIDVSDDTES